MYAFSISLQNLCKRGRQKIEHLCTIFSEIDFLNMCHSSLKGSKKTMGESWSSHSLGESGRAAKVWESLGEQQKSWKVWEKSKSLEESGRAVIVRESLGEQQKSGRVWESSHSLGVGANVLGGTLKKNGMEQ
jgi:hypothetical protein